MTRAELLAYAASMLAPLADECGIPLDDSAAGLAWQLDAVVTATADDADNAAAQQALIEYHALRKFRFALAATADVNGTGVRKGKGQVFAQVESLIDDAANRAASAGHPVAAAGDYGLHVLTLDYLEPETTA